ncbi:condensation domain-containing protein [Rhodococcus pyridinivorans]|uniref:condensation domain-containing protein n=2 Tax=Nocardiaceae TaxID=85025 RepID=UPI0022A9A531|nr:condensation domain-containing protein [Rhodococcus pyridinivorans]MCZ4628303.1 condensation domain-containing protein [Rhodococcus pyridinivorans]MCZ4649591.1 condensation domain-containing protein [Rhodococcus pyridinivorans]MDJ0484605.1 condensation domain-containing protein [Rhodococcus pyridinivorans]
MSWSHLDLVLLHGIAATPSPSYADAYILEAACRLGRSRSRAVHDARGHPARRGAPVRRCRCTHPREGGAVATPVVGTAQNSDARAGAFPLTPAQYGIWLAQQLVPEVPFVIAQYVEFRGELDLELLKWASTTAGREFETVLLRLVDVDGRPYQVVDRDLDVPTEVVDLRDESDPRGGGRGVAPAGCGSTRRPDGRPVVPHSGSAHR